MRGLAANLVRAAGSEKIFPSPRGSLLLDAARTIFLSLCVSIIPRTPTLLSVLDLLQAFPHGRTVLEFETGLICFNRIIETMQTVQSSTFS